MALSKKAIIFLIFLLTTLSAFSADRVFLKGIAFEKENINYSVCQGVKFDGDKVIFTKTGSFLSEDKKDRITVISPILAIIPPLIAILTALIFRQVVLSLFIGIFSGVIFLKGFSVFDAILSSLADTIPSALTSKDHISILIFSTMLGGMVGIISANGGTAAIVKSITNKITSRKTTMFSAFFMGVGIFFDDYANTLIVGNTMRPLFDKFKISREKLAYIVDSTAAPVASLAVISTWIGFEVGVLSDVFKHTGSNLDGYSAFIFSIPYLYYPLITLIFIVFLIAMEKDFGPMLKVEQNVNQDSLEVCKTDEIKTAPPSSSFLAYLPILTVVIVTLLSIILTGYKGNLDFREIFGNGDSFASLIWGSVAGCVVAGVLSLFSKTLNITEVFDSWLDGLKSMMSAVVILTLAWSLSNVCKDIKTADFIMSLLNENFPFWIMPLVTFLISAAMSFATGTSWGTMAIVYPLLIPVVLGTEFLHPTIAAVLSGAVFGDHCSPISDTTIMSSMASSCDHISHVRTQLPYALAVAFIALISGYLPIFFGVHPLFSYTFATLLVFLTMKFLGRTVKKT